MQLVQVAAGGSLRLWSKRSAKRMMTSSSLAMALAAAAAAAAATVTAMQGSLYRASARSSCALARTRSCSR